MKQPLAILYSRRSDGGIQAWEIVVEGATFSTQSWIEPDGARTKSEPTKCAGKQGRTDFEQAIKQAQALWQKKFDSGYRPDKKDIDTKAFFEPMLAHVYEDHEDVVARELDLKQPVFLQPKLDGMRCIATPEGMTSRNGKPILSAPHIHQALCKMMGNDKGWIFDGELYADKFADDFNKIISLAKKSKPTEYDLSESRKHLQYHIYDMPVVGGNFSTRYSVLQGLLNSAVKSPSLVLVETIKITRVSEIEDNFGVWRGRGYEGAMIRLNGDYEQKRSKKLLKYKKFQDAEFTVLEVIEGIGNRAGMAGAMRFKTQAGKEFTAALMGNVSFFRECLFNKHLIVGKQATVQYFNLTPDGLPRFPYVKTIRDYE